MLPAGEPSLLHSNRAFCYGDGLFETIHANGARPQFFHDHYNRLEKGMQILKMTKGSLPDAATLESLMIRLLNKNHLYNGVRIRLSVFRNSGGFYTPEDNSVSFLAETRPLPDDNYILNDKGLKADFFTGFLKYPDGLANLKTANSLLYIEAGLYRKESGLDECFLLNTGKRVIESISSNIFLVKKGALYTPALAEGCVAGIMREQILRLAVNENLYCMETKIKPEDLLLADECFLTNAIRGIQWVGAYRQKRYFRNISRVLVASLNKEQFGT